MEKIEPMLEPVEEDEPAEDILERVSREAINVAAGMFRNSQDNDSKEISDWVNASIDVSLRGQVAKWNDRAPRLPNNGGTIYWAW